MLDRLPTLSPRAYRRVAFAALAALTLIVFSGAAVRLSGSGLGCPNWPKCGGGYVAPLETHAVIEYGNRVFSALVGLVALAAALLAFRRRPYRRDLARLALLLPLGALAQGVLGGLTVEFGLKPGFVMAHFILSMLILAAAVALVWRAGQEPDAPRPAHDAVTVWSVRALLPLGALTIFAGTAATAAGPHAGGAGTGDVVNRLYFKGVETLDWAIHQHARLAMVFGVAAVAVFLTLRRRGADRQAQLAAGALLVLLGLQGVTGTVQYKLLNLPSEVVWAHVVLAALTWVSLLWAVAAAGRPLRREAARPAAEQPAEAERLELETAPR